MEPVTPLAGGPGDEVKTDMNAPLETILVPTDGSVHAAIAVDVAAGLAVRDGARLVLLHVGGGEVPKALEERIGQEPGAADMSGRNAGDTDPARGQQRIERAGRLILGDAERAARAMGAGAVETRLDFGDCAERILHQARQIGADMVVMGSRGYSELQGLLFGSVSHKVYQLAPCTCVTVRPSGDTKSFEGIRAILVPTDGSDHATKAVQLGSDLALRYGARLVLLHVMLSRTTLGRLKDLVDVDQLSETTRREFERFTLPASPMTSTEGLEEIGRQILERARGIARATGLEDVTTSLEGGDTTRAILAAAEREGIDVIAMGNRGLGELAGLFLGSVSHKVSHVARCSCILVR